MKVALQYVPRSIVEVRRRCPLQGTRVAYPLSTPGRQGFLTRLLDVLSSLLAFMLLAGVWALVAGGAISYLLSPVGH